MPEVTAEELFANWKIRLLVYGATGVGKTYLLGLAAAVKEMCPIWMYCSERGMLSIKHIIIGTRRIQPVLGMLSSDLVLLQNKIVNPGPYKTVIIDSLGELHAQILEATMRENGRKIVPYQSDYRDAHNKILSFMRYIDQKAQVHVLATAGDLPTFNEKGQLVAMNPDVVGKLAFRVPRFFDTVAYMEARVSRPTSPDAPLEALRSLQVQPFSHVRAKDRSPGGVLGVVVQQPTMAMIYRALVGDCTEIPLEFIDDPSILIPTYARAEESVEGNS